MRSYLYRPIVLIVFLVVIIGLGIFGILSLRTESHKVQVLVEEPKGNEPFREVIGKSVERRNIEAFTYYHNGVVQEGGKNILFVGGIHGGYEWNSVLLAYQFMDYLDENPEVIPEGLVVTVIPSANPDGVYKVVGLEGRFSRNDVTENKETLASGRFNANKVDLNRNFDCKWVSKSTWQSKTVSAGTSAFSEPETKAIKSFALKENPVAVVFWHSQSNAVYASQCEKGILPVTLDIMNVYSKASGYPAVETFDAYATTGAADDWLASVGIPAITVELKTHEAIEWEKNLDGIKALFEYYSKKSDQ